ncbi:hypothetical protein Bhyg_04232 [Pseudolycoriella hygida]|uniref:Peptidase A2 domain-containing protein n=1 Tax=Pseudolycoriella hygida TaxID=35572 RepID=A0A9Q0SA21_9DIPT|nr:hypothetical protein Bhyg_04232 [Pseudolycoriella hygida]
MLIPLTVNETTFEALVDTGSPYTMMDESLYEQLQLGKWSKSKVSVRGFAGKPQYTLGAIEVNIEIERNILRQAEVMIKNGLPTIVKTVSDGPENDIMTIQTIYDKFKVDECPGIAEISDKKIKSEVMKLIKEYKPARGEILHPDENSIDG